MKRKCLACGIEKDTSAKKVYPFPDDGIIDDEPIQLLFDVHCQGADWRVATVCHQCFHKLDPDMWISEEGWSFLNPVAPFEHLPLLTSETTPCTGRGDDHRVTFRRPLAPRQRGRLLKPTPTKHQT